MDSQEEGGGGINGHSWIISLIVADKISLEGVGGGAHRF